MIRGPAADQPPVLLNVHESLIVAGCDNFACSAEGAERRAFCGVSCDSFNSLNPV